MVRLFGICYYTDFTVSCYFFLIDSEMLRIETDTNGNIWLENLRPEGFQILASGYSKGKLQLDMRSQQFSKVDYNEAVLILTPQNGKTPKTSALTQRPLETRKRIILPILFAHRPDLHLCAFTLGKQRNRFLAQVELRLLQKSCKRKQNQEFQGEPAQDYLHLQLEGVRETFGRNDKGGWSLGAVSGEDESAEGI